MAPIIFQKVRLYLRFKPFDVNTAEGLDQERNRIALLSIFANAGSKGAAMLLVLAGISWTLPYLGEERFGAWMAILSVATVLSFLDLGVGNALTNHVAKAGARGRESLKSAVTGGLLIVAFISIFLLLFFNFIHSYLPWDLVLKSNSPPIVSEINSTIRFFYIAFAFLLYSNAVIKTYAGLQRAHIANSLQTLASIIALIVLFFLAQFEVGIATLLAVTVIPICFTGIVLTLVLIKERLIIIQGSISEVRNNFSDVFSVGGLFFVLQIAVIVGWGGDALIVSSTAGLSAVASFAVVQRLFQFVSQPFAILNSSLWPAYADAHSKNNLIYLKQLFKRSLLVSTIGGGLGLFLLAAAGPFLISFLADEHLQVDPIFIWLFAAWMFIEIIGNCLGTFMNGVGIIRVQVLLSLVFVAVAFPAKILMIEVYGLNGMVLVNITAYLLMFMCPYLYLFMSGKIRAW